MSASNNCKLKALYGSAKEFVYYDKKKTFNIYARNTRNHYLKLYHAIVLLIIKVNLNLKVNSTFSGEKLLMTIHLKSWNILFYTLQYVLIFVVVAICQFN